MTLSYRSVPFASLTARVLLLVATAVGYLGLKPPSAVFQQAHRPSSPAAQTAQTMEHLAFVPISLLHAQPVPPTIPPPGPAKPTPALPAPSEPPSSVYGGCSELEERDYDIDGELDKLVFTQYNFRGFPARLEFDGDADGVSERVQSWAFNASGDPVRSIVDSPNDGNPDSLILWFYRGGGLIRRESDYDYDGQPDFILTHQYGDDGYLRATRVDEDANGSPEVVYLFHYDDTAHDQLVRKEVDFDNDGLLEAVHHYYWQAGNMTDWLHDVGADGTIDSHIRMNYDVLGRLASAEALAQTGETLEVESYIYGPDGWLARTEKYVGDVKTRTTEVLRDTAGRITRSVTIGDYPAAAAFALDCPSLPTQSTP